MEVVVAFEEAGAGGRDHRLKESGGADLGGETNAGGAYAVEEAFEEAHLSECQHEAFRVWRIYGAYMPDKRKTLKVEKGEDEGKQLPEASATREAKSAAQRSQLEGHGRRVRRLGSKRTGLTGTQQ